MTTAQAGGAAPFFCGSWPVYWSRFFEPPDGESIAQAGTGAGLSRYFLSNFAGLMSPIFGDFECEPGRQAATGLRHVRYPLDGRIVPSIGVFKKMLRRERKFLNR